MTDAQPDGLTRRALFGIGAGLAGSAILGACSSGAKTGGTGFADKNPGLALPITEPGKDLPGVTFSKVEGVGPAFSKLPVPGYSSVASTPGSGGPLKAFTITWGPPPLALNKNPWHQAVNKALGVTLDTQVIAAQTFGEKLVTTIASGDIPEITTNEPSYRGRSARKYLPQGVFYDLREFLGGDKVKAYPNIAQVPQYAWANSRIGGALYGVPCYRNQEIGGTLCYRADWAEKGGMDAAPTSKDEVLAWLKAMKAGGGADTYPLATIDQTFNWCGLQVHNGPNNWRTDDAGALVKDLETDEYEAGLAFAASLFKAGLVHPDVLTLTPNPAEYTGYFYSGRVGVSNGNLEGYFGTGGMFALLVQQQKSAKPAVVLPPGLDGGKGTIGPDLGYYCMLSIPSAVKDTGRVEEILRVIDYLCAPIGSKEYYLTHYGVEGHNYTMVDGVPTGSSDPDVASESFLSMLSSFNQGYFYPGRPDDALTAQQWAEKMTEYFVDDPTAGIDSAASFSKGDALAALVQDYVNGIVTGRKPVSDIAELRKRWKANGGDKVREELQAGIAEAKKAETATPATA